MNQQPNYPRLSIAVGIAIVLILAGLLGWKILEAQEITIKIKDLFEMILSS